MAHVPEQESKQLSTFFTPEKKNIQNYFYFSVNLHHNWQKREHGGKDLPEYSRVLMLEQKDKEQPNLQKLLVSFSFAIRFIPIVHFLKHLTEHLKRPLLGPIMQRKRHLPRHIGEAAVDSWAIIPNTRTRITSSLTPHLPIFSFLSIAIRMLNFT